MRKKFPVIIFLLHISIVVLGNDLHNAKKGIIDLSKSNLSKPVKLIGEWIIIPGLDSINPANEKNNYKNVPGYFGGITRPNFFSSQLGSYTYILHINLPSKGLYTFHLPPIHSAYELFINGHKVAVAGKIDSSPKMHPSVKAQVLNFYTDVPQIELRILISNYHFIYGGILTPITIGTPAAIEHQQNRRNFISFFLIGSLLIMGLYHIALFSLLKEDKGSLYFSIVCILIALRELFSGDAYFYDLFPGVNYELSLKILYSIFPISLVAFTNYFKSIYSTFDRKMVRVIWIGSILYIFLVIASNNPVYGKFLNFISLLFLFEALYIIVFVSRKTFKNFHNNALVFAGVSVLFVCFLNDVLFEMGIISSSYLLPLGFFVFTFCQSVLLSIRFTNAFRKSDRLELELIKSNQAYEEAQLNIQREILKAKVETQEETFRQIAEELHDNIGQILLSTKLFLGIAGKQTGKNQTLLHAEESLGKAISEIRLLSKNLNKDWLRQFNLIDNLRFESARLKGIVDVDLHFSSENFRLSMNSDSQVILFRMIQEAIQNSIKHAGGSRIIIEIMEEDIITVRIRDNGKGFVIVDRDVNNPDGNNTPHESNGMGLLNLKQRASVIGGMVSWQSEPGVGTEVRIDIPVKNEVRAK